jgi:uncharacterized Ntn-hydrolase superfamily protein
MKLKFFFALLLYPLFASTQDTFSIVAVDTITGEIGSAGASCLDDNGFPGSNGAIIISDILPGRGAIHTQSYWLAANQANARMKMEEGLSPQEIITWLKANDSEGQFGQLKRQYGIIDFDAQGKPRSAAHTGNSCFAWKGHKLGTTYAIQGNILLGAQILDSMEVRFLAATGTLADRLMACMQGANVPGADSRCLANGTSSLSAFLRVAKPTDADNALYLDLNVPSLPTGMEPIDSLQSLYNQWKLTKTDDILLQKPQIFPNPTNGALSIVLQEKEGLVEIFDLIGKTVFSKSLFNGENQVFAPLEDGVYFVKISANGRGILTEKVVWTFK